LFKPWLVNSQPLLDVNTDTRQTRCYLRALMRYAPAEIAGWALFCLSSRRNRDRLAEALHYHLLTRLGWPASQHGSNLDDLDSIPVVLSSKVAQTKSD
jgi:hypothetical protein